MVNVGVQSMHWYNTWDDSTSTIPGTLIFQSADGSDTSYASMQIDGIFAQTGYYQIEVSPTVGSGDPPFLDGEKCVLSFSRTGDKGTQGIQGI